MTFDDLALDPNVLKAVQEAGYTEPTPIQAQAIPFALQGRDVLGIAQTGTGKTASFTLPMITRLLKGRARARMPRSLILCPTRELAAQVAENFDTYCKHVKLSKALLIGGTSFNDQDKLIDRGVDVLIATPGRLLDHFERGKLMLSAIEIMVVDEADRMLDMGFIPDIERIFKLTPFTRQTLFFSATMPPEITRLTTEFLHHPERIEATAPATTATTVEQKLCRLHPSRKENADREKRELLCEILRGEGEGLKNAIVFCNRKRDIGSVFKSLQKSGFNVGALHGDLDQSVRTATLDGFRNGEIAILVASDVAARGLDIPGVSHVVNFDVPIHSEDYVHRIGRTGRAGRLGKAIIICLPHEEKHLDKIEKLIERPIEPMDVAGASPAPRPPEALAPAPAGDAVASQSERRPRRARKTAPKTEAEPPAEMAQPSFAPGPQAPRADEPSRASRRGEGDRGGRRRGGGRDEQVVGLGDHVPAFLLREVPKKIVRASAEAESDEEAA